MLNDNLTFNDISKVLLLLFYSSFILLLVKRNYSSKTAKKTETQKVRHVAKETGCRVTELILTVHIIF